MTHARKILTVMALAAALTPLAIPSAYGATWQQSIVISAEVGSVLQIQNADGSALNPNIALKWNPETYFSPWMHSVVIFSNNHAADVHAKLSTAAVMVNGATAIPLVVKLNDDTLSTIDTTYAANLLFPGNLGGSGNSIALPLSIGVDNSNPGAKKPPLGTYTASVQIVLSQTT